MSVTAGSTSYWTSIKRSASSATCGDSATTAATGAPTWYTSSPNRKRLGGPASTETSAYSLGRLKRCMMPTTPASFSALLVSMLLILACGYLLRSVLMKTMPGMVMFSVYLPAPYAFFRISSAAVKTESKIFGYSEQRQMLPERASRTWSSVTVGTGVLFSSAYVLMMNPRVQMPHWNPPCCQNARWIGCRSSARVPLARPSMVTTFWPLPSRAASTVQPFTARPSTTTAHAPHCARSHPRFAPTMPSWYVITSHKLERTSTVTSWVLPFRLSVTLRIDAGKAPPVVVVAAGAAPILGAATVITPVAAAAPTATPTPAPVRNRRRDTNPARSSEPFCSAGPFVVVLSSPSLILLPPSGGSEDADSDYPPSASRIVRSMRLAARSTL